jgi:lactonase
VVASSVALLAGPATAQTSALPALRYDAQTSGTAPFPAPERELQTIVAEPWFKVSDRATPLEGPAFERDGNLVLSDVGAGRILRLTPDRQMSVVLEQPGEGMGGLAVDKDGRIFVAATGDFKAGSVGVVGFGAHSMSPVMPRSAGYVVNDLVFDAQGGFYFTDFRGTTTEPTGGVYYVAPDMMTITPILRHVAMANGIALSPDGKRLWVTEFAANRLLRIDLKDATTVADLGTAVAYTFIGPAPDSMRADSAGNLYVALYQQGRVMMFSPGGIPIGQILMPGREAGHNLLLTSMALRPGTDELYIVTNDGEGGQGAGIFRARGFAKALPLYSHQPR